MKNTPEGISSGLGYNEECTGDLEDRIMEIIAAKRKTNFKK